MATTTGVDPANLVPAADRTSDKPVPNWVYAALLAAAIVAYWLPRLFRGFWIDEATAYWIDQNGWSQAWQKLKTFPAGQSILYQYIVSAFVSHGAYKEALLRLPSIAGVLLAAWLLYKLTERIVGARSGWLAVLPFVSAVAIVETATNARPYALGLAVMLFSFWSLREWLHTGARKWIVLYCVSSALVVYFHYLFVIIFVVQALYLIAAKRIGRSFSWLRILAVGCTIAIAAIPLASQMLTLAHQAKTWSTPAKTGFLTFLSFFPLSVLLGAAIGLILFFMLHREWFRSMRALPADDVILLVSWLLLGPLLMFVVQRTASLAVFTTRYLIYALPPCFILLAWCIRHIDNQRATLALVLGVVVGAAMYAPAIGANTPEWRTPLAVAQEIAGSGTPILLRSAHADGVGFDWKIEPNPNNHYFAQLGPYPVRNEIIPVPFFMDASAERYLEEEIQRRAPAHHRFCLVANSDSDAMSILPAWFHNHGYKTSTSDTGGIKVVLFQ